MMHPLLQLCAAGLMALACQSPAPAAPPVQASSPSQASAPSAAPPDTPALERQIIAQGLVEIRQVSPEVVVEMKYSTEDNFLRRDVYGEFDACYLQPEAARMLSRAQDALTAAHPKLRLIVFDCVRPRSVQRIMWDLVKNTPQEPYVAPPGGGGSMHNYGCAVDLGLIHLDTGLVDMGTPFDYFGELAHPALESRFLASGELSRAQASNRAILRSCMRSAGFQGIPHEWWHFIAFSREEVIRRYRIVE
ncbi:MAG: M15 family metallopeptidase [Bacteroidia bacterium]|nr:M15 family metallopeptidase [Bacteroidia bacterium]